MRGIQTILSVKGNEGSRNMGLELLQAEVTIFMILVKYITEHQEFVGEISSLDIGKTMFNVSLEEIMAIREKITWFLSEGERWLKPEYWPIGKLMLHEKTEEMEL